MEKFSNQDINTFADDELDSIVKYISSRMTQQSVDSTKELMKTYENLFQKIEPCLVCKKINRRRTAYTNLYNTCKQNSLKLLSQLLTISQDGEYSKRFQIYDERYYKDGGKSNTVIIRKKINLDNALYLLDYSDIRVKVLRCINQDIVEVKDCNIHFGVEYVDYFNPEILVDIEIEFEWVADEVNLDECVLSIEFEYKYIERGTHLPVWLEHLVFAALYQQRSNYRLELFYSYVSFDSFVQSLYEYIHESYESNNSIEFFKDTYDEYINHGHVSLDWMDSFISSARIQRSIDRVENRLRELRDDAILNIEATIFHTVENWSVQNRRLIEEKLKMIGGLIGINYQKDFKGLDALEQDIQRIKRNRNIIAHGEDEDIDNIQSPIFIVLTFLLSIIFHHDFKNNKWEKLLF